MSTIEKILFAPVQGHTDAAYRSIHRRRYGAAAEYYTPFIRLEHGEVRERDLRDAFGELNPKDAMPVPQVIFRDYDELAPLVAAMRREGATRIDINMGCPFPLQTAKGRGAASVGRPECVEAVRRVMTENPETEFSVKMRLGMEEGDEWRGLLPTLNALKLRHITVHPRIGRQQYKGELLMDEFDALVKESANPVVYNGDITTPGEALAVLERYPGLAGVMVARGLLGRPSLAAEVVNGEEWPLEKRLEEMLKFHRELLAHYESTLCGDHQILSKIKPFWEYAEAEIGRKAWKAIKKSVNMAKYHTAVALVGK